MTSSLSSFGHVSKTPTKTSKSSNSIRQDLVTPQRDIQAADVPRECKCGPDLYSRVLGPTADETILTGLQTVIDLCNKLRVCGDGDESGDEEPQREAVIPERDVPDGPQVESNRNQTKRSMVSAGFQVNPSVKSIEAQTAPFPEMVSEILQTIGLTPETVSKIMQTSFIELDQEQKASLSSIFMQTSNATLHSNAMQTTYPDLASGFVQTSAGLLPTLREESVEKVPTKQTSDKFSDNPSEDENFLKKPSDEPIDPVKSQSDRIPSESNQSVRIPSESRQSILSNKNGQSQKILSEPAASETKAYGVQQAVIPDEHQALSPPESSKPAKVCKCCACLSSSLRRDSKESKSSEEKRPCVCGTKKQSKCFCSNGERKGSLMAVEGDQPPPVEVRYAVTKISKYQEFTTFEVMKSTRNHPRQMPKSIEGVFVLKRKNGNSKSEVEGVYKGSKNGSDERSKNGSDEIKQSTIREENST